MKSTRDFADYAVELLGTIGRGVLTPSDKPFI
jgi:hypothetical protein